VDDEELHQWSPFSAGLVLDCTRASKSWRLVHSHYTICVVHNGRADWEYRREHFSCDPGTVYVCEPGEVHVTRRVYVPGDYTVFFLDPDAVARAAAAVELTRLPHFPRSGVARPDLWRRFAAVKSFLAPSGSEALEQELSGLVTQLLVETQPGAHLPDVKERTLSDVRGLLAERYRADPTRVVRLAPIAEEVGISCSRLVHAFSQRFGVGPYEFVELVRAQHAFSQLRRGPRDACLSLRDVARHCGYSDSAHMSRQIKRFFGTAPRALASELNPSWRGRAMRTARSTTAQD
jgi:AraC-like DNA-binding protein